MKILAAFLLTPLLWAQQPAGVKPDSAKFGADLDLAIATIRDLHPDPYWKNDRQSWRREIASLRFRLDALSKDEFFMELKRIVALLEDGHSGLMELFGGRYLSLRIEPFEDGWFVTRASTAEPPFLLRRRVVAIEGRDTEAVAKLLRPTVCADNEADARRRVARQMSSLRALHAVGVIASTDAVTLTVAEADGTDPREVRVGLSGDEEAATVMLSPGPPMLQDEQPGRPWFVASPDPATRYVRFRAVGEPQPGAFAEFCKQTFTAIANDAEVQRLVLDLRGNGGGSNYLLQPLIHGVIRSRLNTPGTLFVITDEKTFSAAMNCATRLERETWALFVGAPTGARPNHFGDAEMVTLPKTGFRLRCSTVRWWDSDPRDRRRWIQPDLPAPMTLADRIAGRDPALAAIAAYEHRPAEGFDDSQPVAHWFRKSQNPAWPPKVEAAPAAAPEVVEPPPGRESYLGRTIAQTMHWRGAEWLMRATREDEEHTARLFDALALQPGLTVCDMGCGNGYHALPIAERVGDDGKVFAVDIQPQMLAMLKRRQNKRGLENIELIHNTVADPRLPYRSCDLILMVDVYHEFSHPVAMLAGLRRALKPGGRLVLVEFRAEDPDVPIKKLHKMSVDQVTKELGANGFVLHERFDELPWQHVLTFVPKRSQ